MESYGLHINAETDKKLLEKHDIPSQIQPDDVGWGKKSTRSEESLA